MRYNTDGSLDTTFNGTGRVGVPLYGGASGVALQSDGKIVVSGTSYVSGGYHFTLFRYNPNGSLDTSFNGTGTATADFGGSSEWGNGLAIQGDG